MKYKTLINRCRLLILILALVTTMVVPAGMISYAESDYTRSIKTSQLPYTLAAMQGFSGLGGTITSTTKISKAKAEIVNSKGKVKYKKTLKVNSKKLNLARFRKYIKFRYNAGKYYFRVYIYRKDGATRVINHKFIVTSDKQVFYSDGYNGYMYSQFGWKRFKDQGCYLTSVAMVYSNYKHKRYTPDVIHSMMFGGSNSDWGRNCKGMPSEAVIARKLGMRVSVINEGPITQEMIKKYAKKYPAGVICLEYYGGGGTHYFVARVSGSGSLYYNDPAKIRAAEGDHLIGTKDIYPPGSAKRIVKLICLY